MCLVIFSALLSVKYIMNYEYIFWAKCTCTLRTVNVSCFFLVTVPIMLVWPFPLQKLPFYARRDHILGKTSPHKNSCTNTIWRQPQCLSFWSALYQHPSGFIPCFLSWSAACIFVTHTEFASFWYSGIFRFFFFFVQSKHSTKQIRISFWNRGVCMCMNIYYTYPKSKKSKQT